MDESEWREHLRQVNPKALFRVLQDDKKVVGTLFTGFRPGVDALKNPLVQKRLIEVLEKQTSLADSVSALPQETEKPPAVPPPPPIPPPPPSDDPKLKEKLKELRTQLRDVQGEKAQVDAALERAQRDIARLEAERATEQKRREAIEAQREQERRLRERAERRSPEPAAPKVVAPAPSVSAPSPLPAPELDASCRRLLNRGRHTLVAELCQELLSEPSLEIALRGTIHSLYATALAGRGKTSEAEVQECLACDAFIGAGLLVPATEALGRAVSESDSPQLNPTETKTLQRLLALGTRTGQQEEILRVLTRLRVTAPAGFRRLQKGLQKAGKPYADLLSSTTGSLLSPDTPVALPTAVAAAASTTARRLVLGVEAGDESFVRGAREGIETLRRTNAPLADALLEAVAALAPSALFPLVNANTRPVVVDASNVARYHNDPLALVVQKKAPVTLGNLVAMQSYLLRRGFFPVLLIADASLRHVIDERSRYASLVERGVVWETAAGTEADEVLLQEAQRLSAPVVTNDRLAEWGERAQQLERLRFEIHRAGIALLPAP